MTTLAKPQMPPIEASPDNRFNKVQRIWKRTPEYFDDPWGYYRDFIGILRRRGARFITMSQALAGDFDEQQVNVLLDHHIDYYPIETEVMTRWEVEEGLVSSVYLFNRFDYDDAHQRKIWRVEDLDLAHYQNLERLGFEIGYHQNAVGLTRNRRVGRTYDSNLSADDVAAAQKVFAEDVDNLRRYFDVRTFIPHGAGESNAQLVDIPRGYEDLVWVYNNAHRNRTVQPPLSWANYSDSSGQIPQRIRAWGANYVLNVDNMHVKAWLATPGLNHVLTHSGRFGKGMPYELYRGEPPVEEHTAVVFEFGTDDVTELPVRPSRMIRAEEGPGGSHARDAAWSARQDAAEVAVRPDKYRVLTDDLAVAVQHLATNDQAVVFLAQHRDLAETEKRDLRSQRQTNKVSGAKWSEFAHLLATGLISFRDEAEATLYRPLLRTCGNLINLVFTDRLLAHLAKCPLVFDQVHLTRLPLRGKADVGALREVLARYDAGSRVWIQSEPDRAAAGVSRKLRVPSASVEVDGHRLLIRRGAPRA